MTLNNGRRKQKIRFCLTLWLFLPAEEDLWKDWIISCGLWLSLKEHWQRLYGPDWMPKVQLKLLCLDCDSPKREEKEIPAEPLKNAKIWSMSPSFPILITVNWSFPKHQQMTVWTGFCTKCYIHPSIHSSETERTIWGLCGKDWVSFSERNYKSSYVIMLHDGMWYETPFSCPLIILVCR